MVGDEPSITPFAPQQRPLQSRRSLGETVVSVQAVSLLALLKLSIIVIFFPSVVYQDGLYGAEVYVRFVLNPPPHTFADLTLTFFNLTLFVQGGYPAAYRVAQSASAAAAATYSDG